MVSQKPKYCKNFERNLSHLPQENKNNNKQKKKKKKKTSRHPKITLNSKWMCLQFSSNY